MAHGWAGYNLARSLDPKQYQPLVISPRSYFVFTPLLASTSVGTLEFRTALEPIRSRRSKASYIQGWADDVDFYNKTVTVEEGVLNPNQGLALTQSPQREKNEPEIHGEAVRKVQKGQLFDIKYDKLVIAVGCYTQTFGTPGVREYANFLKDVGDARKIRKRLLECFELAALPTTTPEVRRQILHFTVVGGGPTGIEFSAELHDFLREDMSRIFPDLAPLAKVRVLDVAPQVLSMFDKSLAKYAMNTFKREGISIKTSRTVESLTQGLPSGDNIKPGDWNKRPGLTLRVKGEEPIGCGMTVWSTGLMANPFIRRALNTVRKFPPSEVICKSTVSEAQSAQWSISTDAKSGSLMTNDRLRVILAGDLQQHTAEGLDSSLHAYMRDVFAIGDCASIQGTSYPATAQVANQKAVWLAKHLNRRDLHLTRFRWKDLGVMAYVGNWKAIFQPGGGGSAVNLSGRAAWFLWRSAYLFKSVSWRNRILIPVYW
ncbi:MAG: hypothetical protein M1831_007380 [Alyxoria varia]|nr:MAG: hypothetical protein M1831_007380 [Alyxoria varia]